MKWRREFLWDDRAWVYDLDVGRYHPAMRKLELFNVDMERLKEKLAVSRAKVQKNLEKLNYMAGVRSADGLIAEFVSVSFE